MKQILSTGILLALVLFGTTASAAKKTWHVEMDPGQENVTPDVGGHNPKGSGDFTYDDVTKQLCGRITYSDLTGPAAGIHIHQAPPGDPTGDGTVKLLVPIGASPVTFNFTLDAAFEESLVADELYANIHTAMNPKGELRSFTPWVVSNGAEVPCPGPTNPDGGGGSPGDGGTGGTGDGGTGDGGTADGGKTSGDGGTSPGTTTSSSSSTGGGKTTPTSGTGGAGGNSESESSTSGGGAIDTEPQAEDSKSGCNTTASPTDAASLGVVTAIAALAFAGRLRRKKR